MPQTDQSQTATSATIPPVAPIQTASLAASSNVPVPQSWEPQPLSEMRKASYLVHGKDGTSADISFVTLGGSAGNLLGNVNRWLAQIGQPAITEEQLQKLVEHLPAASGEVALVDLHGLPEQGDPKTDGRIVAAIAPLNGSTGFFKMRGNADLVGAEKDHFVTWLTASLTGQASTPAVATMPATLPPAESSDAPRLQWQLPDGWTPKPPSPMRYASFAAGGENAAAADISVVTFPGDGGSDIDNVNRWRQQIGLPPANPGEIAKMTTPVQGNDASFSTIDVAGSSSRMLAGWTRKGGRAWFFKLTGPEAVVEREKSKFVTFLQSVRF